MGKKHDAVLDDVLGALTGDLPTRATAPAPPPGPGAAPEGDRAKTRFMKRSSALSARLSGEVEEKTLRWVDPARCKMWDRHNRRYDLLDETRCADLIEGFKAQGRQEFAAIVRPAVLSDGSPDPDHDWEVICGARRHWTVSWLRANNYPDFKFLIDPRDLSDETAFRLSDIENRDREDISDYERALDYADALARYYGAKQKSMADRLEVSETWLSRYLMLARLPKAVVEAYAVVTDIKERHARELNPLLARKAPRAQVLDMAEALRVEQAARRAEDRTMIDGPSVFARLKGAGATSGRPVRVKPVEIARLDGVSAKRPAGLAKRGKGGTIVLELDPGALARDGDDNGSADEALLAFCRRALDAAKRA